VRVASSGVAGSESTPPASTLSVRDLTVDDFDAVLSVQARSFGLMSADRREEWKLARRAAAEERRLLGVVDADQVVAAARVWDFGQWWHGRVVPMGGVAGVVVDPEYRGRGAATLLMRAVIDRCRAQGLVLSALYASALPVYRKVGYEIGGGRYRYSFPAQEVRRLGRGSVLTRRATGADAERLRELVAAARTRSRESGPVRWPLREDRRWLDDEETFAYLADDGFVVYRWEDSDLTVDELIALSPDTTRSLWGLVGSGASIAASVHAYVAPHDPIHLLLGREAGKTADVQRWMLRLIDVPAAIAARGWPADVRIDVPIELDDVDVPDNAGCWRLQLSAGVAQLTPEQEVSETLRLGPRGMAALYAGTSLAMLRLAGLATGGSADADAQLDAAFGGSATFMLDYF
jgi:predicted acetyltransferase